MSKVSCWKCKEHFQELVVLWTSDVDVVVIKSQEFPNGAVWAFVTTTGFRDVVENLDFDIISLAFLKFVTSQRSNPTSVNLPAD